MKAHNLVQGSPEWLAHRAKFFNASDAPAMMGCSPYKTRTQLLHELHTGLVPEVDAGTQRRFDDGHRFEALARPLAEAIIGDDLYPVTGSEGKLSASFDGLTMAEDTAFEHKTLNDDLRACMKDEGNGYGLPMQYQVQMEQQLMVSGAERVLFMASKWDGDELIEKRHCWYASDDKVREAIERGWEQFAIDLAAYTPAAQVIEVIGHTPESLPALRIEVTGMVTASNLEAYKTHALAVFGSINRELKTDQQFADAEKVVKWCSDIEDRLAAAKQHALSQTESIDALFRAIDDISAEARRTRLEFDKLVKARKEAVKSEILQTVRAAYDQHIAALTKDTGGPWIVLTPPDFAGKIKGLRTIASLQDAVNTELARAKIIADESARNIRANLACIKEDGAGYEFLFSDKMSLLHKTLDDLKLLVKSRIAEHQQKESARLEAETARITAEVEAKAKRDADEAERKRLAAAAELEEAQAATTGAELSPAAQALNEAEGAQRFAAFHPKAVNMAPVRTAPAVTPMTPPTLKLGQIGERLGFNVTADFLKSLGFEPAARDKSALLFHEASFTHICAALVNHIINVQDEQDEQAA